MRHLLIATIFLVACGAPVAEQPLAPGAKAEAYYGAETRSGQVTVTDRFDDGLTVLDSELVKVPAQPTEEFVALRIEIAPSYAPEVDVSLQQLADMRFLFVSRHKETSVRSQLQIMDGKLQTSDYVGSRDGTLGFRSGCWDLTAAFRMLRIDRTNEYTDFSRGKPCSNGVFDYAKGLPPAFENPGEYDIYVLPIPVDGERGEVQAGQTYHYTLTFCAEGPCEYHE